MVVVVVVVAMHVCGGLWHDVCCQHCTVLPVAYVRYTIYCLPETSGQGY
jgi:hypothetical protein